MSGCMNRFFDMIPDAPSSLIFFVNGKKVTEENPDPEWMLLFYLRRKLNLCGTKLGCSEGGCGACTVMVSRFDWKRKKIKHLAVNACLFPVCLCHGLAITTVEGIGNTWETIKGEKKTNMHPVQERLALAHGSQCGFCTPGFVMSMYTLLRSLPENPSFEDIEKSLHGNLCRCTGYRPILEAFKTFIKTGNTFNNDKQLELKNVNSERLLNGQEETWNEGQSKNNGSYIGSCCSLGENCCKYKLGNTSKLFDEEQFIAYDRLQEPIFPPELLISSELDQQFLIFKGRKCTWYRPQTLEELLTMKEKFPVARIVVGNTEIGIETKFKNCIYPILIHPSQVQELSMIEETSEGIKIGAAVTLEELEAALRQQITKNDEQKTRIFSAVVDMLHWFAGKQIRNVAGVGGNIMTGSPISDLNPIFVAAECKLEVMSKGRGLRTLVMDEHFFIGYRRNILRPEEILLSITIPYSKEGQYFFAFKQSKRKVDDIAIVNAGMTVELELGTSNIKKLALTFGGMAPTIIVAKKTAEKLKGREWSDKMLEDAYVALMEDLPLPPDAPGGVVQYRRSLSLSFFFKFYLKVSRLLPEDIKMKTGVPEWFRSGADELKIIPFKSSQCFKTYDKDDLVIGKPLVHNSALQQATGEAVYCDDLPHFQNEGYMALVKSTKAHAKIISIDTKCAMKMKGVMGIFTAKDLPEERNKFGPILKDEEIFASNKVVCQGQVVAAVIAEDQQLAQEAAKAVKIYYEDLSPVIITIEDAIKQNSFYHDFTHVFKNGDVDKGFEQSDHVISGEIRIGGQEHFYLETMSVVVVPEGEGDEMNIYCSTQNPTEIQATVANVLGIPANRITCKVKRMGGGFGGKESRCCLIALPAAVAAKKLRRPIRCMLDRDEDMIMTGTRHPYLGKYKVGFSCDGKIIAYELMMYSNAGSSLELSVTVIRRSTYHLDNAYYIPNVKCSAYLCKTNLPSNTGFRGFGAPQSMFFVETVIRHVAAFLKKDAIEVTFMNFYKTGDKTHYNQELTNCTLSRCWEKCLIQADYFKRKKQIDEHNTQNRWKKKGISMVPTKLGIGFAEKFLNQAGALLIVYTDGSVLLSHGGTEMGQGLHTKMIQVASQALGIPVSLIHITDTATDKVPNTSGTAASSSSDLNGMAVLNACEKIMSRLAPYRSKLPKSNWKEWVEAAYMDRVSLSATGFYGTPDIDYDPKTNSGRLYNYYTYGVGCSEVEIDCLTGDHQVIRTDIVMDIGESMNPAVDIGQIEGGFMQGMGLFTLEELHYSPDGTLLTRGPGTYKIPAISNIPRQFNVSLLTEASNPRAVYSSKAVGEPPLFLSASVFFALKEAIVSARSDSDNDIYQHFRLDAPATAASIRMSCKDNITSKLPKQNLDSFIPWTIRP